MIRRLLIVATLFGASGPAAAQELQVGLYAPSAPFKSSDDARAYVESLARLVESATGTKTSGRVYFRYDDLARARPHLAVIDPRCAASRKPGAILATAGIDGQYQQSWSLYAKTDTNVRDLAGAKIAYPMAGCADDAFVAHALLHSMVPKSHFGPRIDQKTPQLARDALERGSARAAFLPASAAKNLQRLLTPRRLAPPVLVRLRPLSKPQLAAIRSKVIPVATLTYAITGFKPASRISLPLHPQKKKPLLVGPPPYRLPAADMVELSTKPGPRPSLRHHLK